MSRPNEEGAKGARGPCGAADHGAHLRACTLQARERRRTGSWCKRLSHLQKHGAAWTRYAVPGRTMYPRGRVRQRGTRCDQQLATPRPYFRLPCNLSGRRGPCAAPSRSSAVGTAFFIRRSWWRPCLGGMLYVPTVPSGTGRGGGQRALLQSSLAHGSISGHSTTRKYHTHLASRRVSWSLTHQS